MLYFNFQDNRARAVGMALLAVSTLPLFACGDGGNSSAEAAPGQRLFVANCALCHGQNAEGKAMLGKGLQANEFVRNLSDQELVEFLKAGRRADHPLNERGVDMPPKGGNPGLSDEDLQLIVVYLRSLS